MTSKNGQEPSTALLLSLILPYKGVFSELKAICQKLMDMASIKDIITGTVRSSRLVSHLFSLPAPISPYKLLTRPVLVLSGQAEKALITLHFNNPSPSLEKMVKNH